MELRTNQATNGRMILAPRVRVNQEDQNVVQKAAKLLLVHIQLKFVVFMFVAVSLSHYLFAHAHAHQFGQTRKYCLSGNAYRQSLRLAACKVLNRGLQHG